MEALNLAGKNAIVTGARQGIGKETAVALARQGANVVVIDLALAKEDAVCREIESMGVKCLPLCCDVSDEKAVEKTFAHIQEGWGQPDILVNNAGVTKDAMARKMNAAQFMEVINVSLLGSFLCSRQGLLHMREKGGSIVNFSSIAGVMGNMGQANYSAAKSGILGLTKTLALEGARDGIRVNAVVPGFIDTPMTQAMPAANREAAIARIPLGRMGSPQDVANAVLFLASDMSSFITGHALQINGGRFM